MNAHTLEYVNVDAFEGFINGLEGTGMNKAPTAGKEPKELKKVLTETQMNQIRTLADCDMNQAWAARVLGITRKSIELQMTRIKKNTGLNPLCFYDLCELLYFDVEKKA